MTTFPILIRPIGGRCTLSCEHCWLPQGQPLAVMSDDTMRKIVTQYEFASDERMIVVQGLEPMQAGLSWFKRLVEFASEGTRFILQTAGVHLDPEWCEFLALHNWTVGISHDGPRNMESRGIRSEAIDGKIMMLAEHKIPYSVLCTVTKGLASMQYAADTMRHFGSLGVPVVQYIVAKASDVGLPDPGPSGPTFAIYLATALEVAMNDELPTIIDNINSAGLAWDGKPSSCEVCANGCGSYLVADHTGAMYPCDFEMGPEWRLGDVHTSTVEAAFVWSQRMAQFRRLKGMESTECESCEVRVACNRGCPRDRYLVSGDYTTHTPQCAAHKLCGQLTRGNDE